MNRILLVLLIFSSVAYGQSERLSASAHFGYSLSNWLWNGGTTDFRSTFNAGLEVRRQLGQSGFYLQSGIRWNEYGFRQWTESWIHNGEFYVVSQELYKKTHFFLSVPLIATYKFKKGIPGFMISAGPQMSFYTFSKSKWNGETNFFDDDYPTASLGINSSLGYERNLGDRFILGGSAYSNINFPIGWFFGLDGEYNFGLSVVCRYILKKNEGHAMPVELTD